MARIELLAAVALFACACGSSSASGTGTGGSDGGSDKTKPQAIVALTTSNGGCGLPGSVSIGSFGDGVGAPKPVKDSDVQNGTTIRVQCRVAPAADGFEVHAAIAGDTEGNVTLDAKVDVKGNASAPTIGVSRGTTTSSAIVVSCALSGAVRTGSGVATGRYWGGVDCTLKPTSGANETCKLTGEIRLEDCAQQ